MIERMIHCTVINIKGESYRLKWRKELMRQKQQIVNTLFEQVGTKAQDTQPPRFPGRHPETAAVVTSMRLFFLYCGCLPM